MSTVQHGYIYGLRLKHDPTHEYRYVGKTSRTVEQRLREHIRASRDWEGAGVLAWIKKHNGTVIADVLEVESVVLLSMREIQWVHILKTRGYRLLNQTEGGDGCAGYKQSPDHVERRISSQRGVPFTDSRRAALRDAWTRRDRATVYTFPVRSGPEHPRYGSTHSEATREAIAQSLREYNLLHPRPRKVVNKITKEEQISLFLSSRDRGRHTRWHTNRGIVNPDCRFCEEDE